MEKLLVGDVAQPLRMQGQYFDEETRLCYNRYRYFDPASCSFISQDPIGLAGGENVYAYAPNVWGWVDPLGLCKEAKSSTGPGWFCGNPKEPRKKTYHRLKTAKGQTDEVAMRQEQSNEIWGKPPENIFASDIPKVKAYDGPLPEGAKGVEFRTDIPPDKYGVPGKPTWSGDRADVINEDGFAKIKVVVTKNTQK